LGWRGVRRSELQTCWQCDAFEVMSANF
jgi:hypothetical protein